MSDPLFSTLGAAAAGALAVAIIGLGIAWFATARGRRRQGLRNCDREAGGREDQCAGQVREPGDFVRYLQQLREQEKRKIARSLHDELGSLLVSAKMDVETVGERLQSEQPELASRLLRARDAIEQAVVAKRRIVDEIYPTLLDNLGLAAAVEWEVSEACRHNGLDYAVELAQGLELPSTASIMLFRIVQAALANAIAHAGATKVEVTIAVTDTNILLLVEDDGAGIAESALHADGARGIADMRQRARLLGGDLLVRRRPAPESGTVVEANIPLSQADAHAAA